MLDATKTIGEFAKYPNRFGYGRSILAQQPIIDTMTTLEYFEWAMVHDTVSHKLADSL